MFQLPSTAADAAGGAEVVVGAGGDKFAAGCAIAVVLGTFAAAGTADAAAALSVSGWPSITLRSLTGVSGSSSGTSPKGASASAIALTSVGGPMIAPPSPTPRNPPSDFEGVQACRYSKSGISQIAGNR